MLTEPPFKAPNKERLILLPHEYESPLSQFRWNRNIYKDWFTEVDL